ncbi:hypothetical protein PY254_17200 [Rhodanobacter sp. AS-Z3]|uniref:hypothetical protein n=1 Tax=Rhodanobacter sp. AS-Z3 TaxID=3031330 RepID=UPI002479F2E5|nr:hypothetical protein [Rhodanobacter sp. AS-Z3]WEN14943.1 hypothetical protein PY254_17200 [Rhodanobacter sp. AS-Z3]
MTNLRRTLTVLAIASALMLAGCNSGQGNSSATQPATAVPQASAAAGDALTPDQVNVQVSLQGRPSLSADGQWINVTTNLTNNGKTTLTSTGAHAVNLGARAADTGSEILDKGFPRAQIPDIAPGSQASVSIRLPVDQLLGKSAEILPVQEGIAWFDRWGTKPLTVGPFSTCANPTIGKVCDAEGKPLVASAQ